MKTSLSLLCVLLIYGCNIPVSKESSPDTCFTLYKIILRPDKSVADSIFMNCNNENLLYHRKRGKNGKLQSTGYMLNNKLHGLYTVYEDDGKTISFQQTWDNGERVK
jgi:antitoxin component YwqK of YwqJK toxin-antitoxin module